MKILLTFIAGISFLSTGMATHIETTKAELVVKDTVNSVMLLLADKDLDEDTKKNSLIESISSSFDFALMGKLSLGSKNWRKMDNEQQTTYTDLFITQIQDSYLNKLKLYNDEKVIFEDGKQVKKKVHVPTTVISKGDKISILYKLYKPKASKEKPDEECPWKVYDLEIQGISVIRTNYSQYNQIIKEKGIDGLIEKMKQKDEIADVVEIQ